VANVDKKRSYALIAIIAAIIAVAALVGLMLTS
jgi:hypothetical protein